MRFPRTILPLAIVGVLAGGRTLAYDYSLLPPMTGQKSDFAERRAGTEVNASIRIGITSEGLYRVSYASLTNVGVLPAHLVGAMMRLFCRTQEIAILVSNTNQWTSSDYFLFPGTGFDGYYSATNVYWLGFGAGGKRMANRSASPLPGAPLTTSARFKALHHVDYYFKDTYRWNDTSLDHWVDQTMSLYVAEQPFALPTDNVVTNDGAVLEAVMLGYGVLDHTTKLRVNSNEAGQFSYAGEVTAVIQAPVPGAWLSSSNTVWIQQRAGSNDLAYVERLAITYSRVLAQTNNALFFDGRTGTNNYQVGGFASSNMGFVLDVTDPANAVVLTASQVTNTGGGIYAVLFGDMSAATSRYGVCHASGIRDVPSLQRTWFRGLASVNQGADYVVICPNSFRSQVYRLLVLRKLQGLSVAVAPLQDIYNEFSYGIADAAGIKQFIGYAFHYWNPPPRYLLLAGSGSYNPRYLPEPHGVLLPDIVPVHLGPGNGAWVALDGWYAAVNESDSIPDIPLGRLPVLSVDELKAVIDKMVSFEGMPANYLCRSNAMMVSDIDDLPSYDFSGASDRLASTRFDPAGFRTVDIYGDNLNAHSQVIQGINSNMFVVNYFGHGDHVQWASNVLLRVSDAAGLTNSVFPIMSMMTCLNGSFQGSKDRCLVSAFLAATNHGASACVAASGLASLIAAEPFMDGFYRTLLGDRCRRIGDSLLPAYSSMSTNTGFNASELQFFELFGDPAMIVNP